MKCCELSAADLRHRVDLRRGQDAPDGQGGFTKTFVTYAGAVRARIVPTSSREAVYLDSLRSTLVARCTLRFRADVLAGDVVLFGGVMYQIKGEPRDIENMRRWLELDLEKLVAV